MSTDEQVAPSNVNEKATESLPAPLWPLAVVAHSCRQCSNLQTVAFKYLNTATKGYLKRGGLHHLIIGIIIRIPELLGFLPLHIRTPMKAQASS